MKRRHKIDSYPLFNYNSAIGWSNDVCGLYLLTPREVYILQVLLGKFNHYRSRWFTKRSGSEYTMVNEEQMNNAVGWLEELEYKIYGGDEVCNQALADISDSLKAVATSAQNINSTLEDLIRTQEDQSINIGDIVDELAENPVEELDGVLGVALKLDQLFDIIPNIDVRIRPMDVVNTVLNFKAQYTMKQTLDRATKYLGVMANAKAGSDVVALAETVWDALPVADQFDFFSEYPEITIDIARVLQGLLVDNELSVLKRIEDVMKDCCKGDDVPITPLGDGLYSSEVYKGHSNYCQMLSTLLGRILAALKTLQRMVNESYPTGTSAEEKVTLALQSMYGSSFTPLGEGVIDLVKLAQSDVELDGVVNSFREGIPVVMSMDCNTSPSELIHKIKSVLGLGLSQHKEIFNVLAPPNVIDRVLSGSYDVSPVYVTLYGSNCGCDTPGNNYSSPLFEAFTINDYKKILVGHIVPYEQFNVLAGPEPYGYTISTKDGEVKFIGDRACSTSEKLEVEFYYDYPYSSATVVEVSIEFGGVGFSLGATEVGQGKRRFFRDGISPSRGGVPAMTLEVFDSDGGKEYKTVRLMDISIAVAVE